MVSFEKTRVHAVSAVLFLIGLYALAGGAYAAFTHSREAMVIWALVAALVFLLAVAYQRHVAKKRGRTG